jgi:F-type H+-transporting ATPase subunit b
MLNFTVTFFITIANLLFLFFVLRRLLFKPVSSFMAARTKKVKDDIEEANRAKRSALTLELRYKEILEQAEEEALWVKRDAEEEGRLKAEALLVEARKEAQAILDHGKEELAAERLRAEAELKEVAVMIAVSAASKLVAKDFDGESNRDFVRSVLSSRSTGAA